VSGRLRLGAQFAAVAVVVALVGLLAWKVISDEGAKVPRELDSSKTYPAPDFKLPHIGRDGELSLASLRGKAVVINFWASWCVPCKQEAPLLEAAWKRYRDRGLVVLGIDVQDLRSDAAGFARRFKITYPLVRDRRGGTLTPYAVSRLPETLFVNRRGRLVGERILGGIHVGDNEELFEEGIALALA
jgi:cytochrome c biogenesis protein CcmG/thiol:disulfide interchange protein DsbE